MHQSVIDFDALRRERRPAIPYWNTTPLPRDQLAEAIRAAERQDEAVVAIFRAHTRAGLSPSRVHAIGLRHGMAWLLTSVRRSMTNLADPATGVLVHTGAHVDGPHGRPEGVWQLR